jgi:hypothetical protein
MKHLKPYLPLIAIAVVALLASDLSFAQQAIPSVPAPSGVTLSSNPLDDGVSLFKWMIKIVCVLGSLAALATAMALGMPKFAEASRGKATYGEASFNMFMLILGAVVVATLAAFVYGKVDGGGAANRTQAAFDVPVAIEQRWV